jgi:hypothetical protein
MGDVPRYGIRYNISSDILPILSYVFDNEASNIIYNQCLDQRHQANLRHYDQRPK